MITADQRNAWLRLDDAALLRDCDQRYVRASGPGGQNRNKVETGVELLHRPSGVTGRAVEERYREVNQRKALDRVRLGIALGVRCAPNAAPEFAAHRSGDGKLAVRQSNADYPLVLATALDALAAAGGSYAIAAQSLGVTGSQLRRLMESDPQVVRALSEQSKQ